LTGQGVVLDRTPEYLFEWPYLTGESAQYLAELGP